MQEESNIIYLRDSLAFLKDGRIKYNRDKAAWYTYDNIVAWNIYRTSVMDMFNMEAWKGMAGLVIIGLIVNWLAPLLITVAYLLLVAFYYFYGLTKLQYWFKFVFDDGLIVESYVSPVYFFSEEGKKWSKYYFNLHKYLPKDGRYMAAKIDFSKMEVL